MIAINPFKSMPLYNETVMEQYHIQGEKNVNCVAGSSVVQENTPFKRRTNDALIKKMNMNGRLKNQRLPSHDYQTADDAYRAMMRGLENNVLMNGGRNSMQN